MLKRTPSNNQIYAYQRQLYAIQQGLLQAEQSMSAGCSAQELPYIRKHIEVMKRNIQEQANICEQLL